MSRASTPKTELALGVSGAPAAPELAKRLTRWAALTDRSGLEEKPSLSEFVRQVIIASARPFRLADLALAQIQLADLVEIATEHRHDG